MLLAVMLLLSVSLGWFAVNPIRDWYVVPDEDDILVVIGEAQSAKGLNPERIRVLVWNMQKSTKEDWESDFSNMIDRYDLALLQEFLLTTDTEITYDKTRQMRWDFAAAFLEKESEAAAGVATGSAANPSKVEFRRAPVNEPFTQTPKMTLITYYPLAGAQHGRHELLVANIHAINFRGERPFKRQLDDLMTSLIEHAGPVLFAGDFNTWSDDRMDELERVTGRAGLTRVEFGDGQKSFMGNVLDHAFVRDLQVVSSRVLTDVESSDHSALEMELEFEMEDGTPDAPQ
jgi:endonuclease/exonuclease/phosphatase (EEP) superfamily protein YafD